MIRIAEAEMKPLSASHPVLFSEQGCHPGGFNQRSLYLGLSPPVLLVDWGVMRPGALVASFALFVVRPGAPSSFLLLVAMPGAPSSILAPSRLMSLLVDLCAAALEPTNHRPTSAPSGCFNWSIPAVVSQNAGV